MSRREERTGRTFRSGENAQQGLARESQGLAELHFESSADSLATEAMARKRSGAHSP